MPPGRTVCVAFCRASTQLWERYVLGRMLPCSRGEREKERPKKKGGEEREREGSREDEKNREREREKKRIRARRE